MDQQKPYTELILGFIGFKVIHPIVIEPTMAAPADVESTIKAAFEQAQAVAAQLEVEKFTASARSVLSLAFSVQYVDVEAFQFLLPSV